MVFSRELDCEVCETELGLGRAGICDVENDTCICPDGFSGRDDWIITPTCHVNETVALVIHALQSIIVTVVLSITVISHVVLTRRWNLTLAGKPLHDNSDYYVKAKGAKSYEMKRNTLRANALFGIFAFLSALYNFPFLFGLDRDQRRTVRDDFPWQALAQALAVSCLFGGLYSMLLTWYKTLPSVRAYGNLLKMSPFLIKYPSFIERFSYFMMTLAAIGPTFLAVIIPSFNPDFVPFQLRGFNMSSLMWPIIFLVVQYFVAGSVIKTFVQGVESLDLQMDNAGTDENRERNRKERKILEQAIVNAKLMRRIAAVFMIFISGLSLVWLSQDQNHQYLVYSIMNQGCYMASLFLSLGIAFKTNGGLLPFLNAPPTSLNSRGTETKTVDTSKSRSKMLVSSL